MFSRAFYAHSRDADDSRPWQLLKDHLEEVGGLAASFAPKGLKDLARMAGRWHDIGKYQAAFQHYLQVDPELSNEGPAQRVNHSGAGAALAIEVCGPGLAGVALAAVIETHHGSLKALANLENVCELRGEPLLQMSRSGGMPSEIEKASFETLTTLTALDVRMLFSALVDADLINTEAWDRGYSRDTTCDSMEVLRDRLEAYCEDKIKSAANRAGSTREQALTAMRRSVFKACLEAAARPQHQFTLTVPTGGGKTLSGLAFALRHAYANGLRRVIVVVPYTSILEQTADVYRAALGATNVIEHHSNLDPSRDTDRNRQATENWDAPVIVTTSVQLFESLYSAHKRSCRKLHRIAQSVILLDEVQTFPANLLEPIHRVLGELVDRFGCTVVHGTATQPLLSSATAVDEGLPSALGAARSEIIPGPATLFNAVRDRFRLEVLGDLRVPLDPSLLAQAARAEQAALVITHRRTDAQAVALEMGDDAIHLSATMCAAHRGDVLREVRRRLDGNEPCRVVSTQLIEAGVDIDFPVVFRALAGLDTLAQAAGRCNRSMRLEEPGRFVVYRAGQAEEKNGIRSVVESRPPKGTPMLGMQIAASMYFEHAIPDLSDPGLFPAYTRLLLSKCTTDSGVLGAETSFNFPEAEKKFTMIDERNIAVVAPYGEAGKILREISHAGPNRGLLRSLQRYTVGVAPKVFDALLAGGWLDAVFDQATGNTPYETLWAVREGGEAVYDHRFGFAVAAGDVKLNSLQV